MTTQFPVGTKYCPGSTSPVSGRVRQPCVQCLRRTTAPEKRMADGPVWMAPAAVMEGGVWMCGDRIVGED